MTVIREYNNVKVDTWSTRAEQVPASPGQTGPVFQVHETISIGTVDITEVGPSGGASPGLIADFDPAKEYRVVIEEVTV